ncbi:MAG: FAD-dependent oxidoreductase, partial [Actinomycetota bacterium]
MESLDAVSLSVWTATSPTTSYPQLSADHVADAAVVGGGITGLTTALLLLRQGLSVVLMEADRIAS